MIIAFRVDVASEIGNGHLQRCLTLALALRTKGANCFFILQPLNGLMTNAIVDKGFKYCVMPQVAISPADDVAQSLLIAGNIAEQIGAPVDFWVVDVYRLDASWHKSIRATCQGLLVIDDLADRNYHADFLLDQTPQSPGQGLVRYQKKVNSNCVFFLGVQYALLRDEFSRLRALAMVKPPLSQPVNNILVSLGGTDPYNGSGAVITELMKLPYFASLNIALVLASNAPYLAAVQEQFAEVANVTVWVDVKNMAELIFTSHLAIGAAGVSALERACLGLPSLQFVLADNQKWVAQELCTLGCAITLGNCDQAGLYAMAQQLTYLRDNSAAYQQMSKSGLALCDGEGATRVAKQISQYIVAKKSVEVLP